MSKIFKDIEAKKEFTKIYHSLSADEQEKFGNRVRELANEKITRLDLVDDFYVDRLDVLSIYNQIK